MRTKRVIKVYKNDKLYDLQFTLQDDDGNVVDLTGVTAIVIKVQKQGVATLKFTGSMVVTTATSGIAKYTLAATDFDEVGTFLSEIQVTYASGAIVTFNNFIFSVKEELPQPI